MALLPTWRPLISKAAVAASAVIPVVVRFDIASVGPGPSPLAVSEIIDRRTKASLRQTIEWHHGCGYERPAL